MSVIPPSPPINFIPVKMNTVCIATGNENKFKSASRQLKTLGISTIQENLDLIEPQDSNILNVVEFKAKQAYSILNKPVLVADTGWEIPTLGGFPGPYMHDISEWFKTSDFLNLMRNKTDRTINIWNTLAFANDNEIKIFDVKRTGRILESPKGEGISIDQIVTFRKDGQSLAQCHAQDIPSFDDEDFESLWTTFGKWYLENSV